MRVLVAANSAVMRVGLETVLSASSALTVVGQGLADATLIPQIERLEPDVLLLEVDPEEELLTQLLSLPLSPAIVLLSDDLPDLWAVDVLRSGVRALLPRQATASEITAAVEAVAIGLVVLHPSIVDSLLLPAPTRSLPSTSQQALTPREIEVLGMLAEGLGNKTIAKRLGISEHTVKFHISSIFTKLNASSRTEAVMLGARQGLILL